MAIIGQSKNMDLLTKVTTEGSKYRDLTYEDTGNTEPLVVTKLPDVLSTEASTGPTADLKREVKARIDDTKRIAKLLTTYQGIKWQGHNAALTAIQNQLDSKRGKYAGEGSSTSGLLGMLLNVGKGLLKTLDWDAVTLAQTAVAGTGEHFSAWQSRAYLNNGGGLLQQALNAIGIGTEGGGAAAEALASGHVTINSEDPAKYYQLPSVDSVDGTWEEARLTKDSRTGGHKGGLWNQSPKIPYNYHTGVSAPYYYTASVNPNGDGLTVVESNVSQFKKEFPGDIGPWKPDGAHALIAAKTPSENKGTSDGGYNNDGGGTDFDLSRMGSNADTRVDNGRIDLIPFWIRAVCPPGGEALYGSVPSGENGYLFFEANLDSYSDNYEASWEGTQYVGRADKFWNYNGFDRNISFSFKMVAHSKAHLKPIYNRLNGLLSMTAPTYGNNEYGGSFMRGTLAEITIGDLLSKQLGFIKSVGLKWETDYMWEIDGSTILVPHVLDVSINFTPIHRFVPHTDLRYFQLVNDTEPGVPTFTVNYQKLYSTTGSLARQ